LILNTISCSGQNKSKTVKSEDSFGTIVTELPQRIWAIFQDKNDNYWFGSNGYGVYMFDGNTITKYTKEDGLIDDAIRGVQDDAQGNLYFETPAGISIYDGKAFTTLKLPQIVDKNWQLLDDDLWFNTNGSANDIYRFDGEKFSLLQLPDQDLTHLIGAKDGRKSMVFTYNAYSVFGVDKDKSGNLWLGTINAGAFRFNGENFMWFDEEELGTLPDGRVPGVRSIIQDKEGYFWLSNIVSKYKITSDNTYEKLPGIDLSQHNVDIELPYFMSSVLDDSNDLWMLSYGDGLWKYDGKDLTQFNFEEDNNYVNLMTIYKDNNGKLWVGTDNGSVYVYNGSEFEKWSIK